MTPLVVFTAAWALGIVLAQAAVLSPVWFLLALPAALVVGLGWKEHPRLHWGPWFLMGLLLGVGRFLLAQPHIDATHIAAYNGAGQVTVEGVVSGYPDRRPLYANLRVRAEHLTLSDGVTLPVHGTVLVNAPLYPQAHYGDRIVVRGSLEEPPVFDTFSYKDYLARQNIHTLLRRAEVAIIAPHQGNPVLDALFRFKDYALARLLAILPEPQASLQAGILLGVESGIPDSLDAAFAATGTSHIVAISGFNITIIAGVFAQLARRVGGRRTEAWLALTGVGVYAVLVGGSAAVLRAAFMGGVVIFARLSERRIHGPTSLAAAALAMTLLDPWVLWDVGFLLSFAATAGLIFYTEPLTCVFRRGLARFTSPERAERLVGLLSDALIVTLAAQITTTPIILAIFKRLSLVTLLTNFLILPAQSLVMLCGGSALLLALVWLPLGQLAGWAAWVFLTYTIDVVYATARIPYASVPVGHVTRPLVWGYYLLLGLITLWLSAPAATRWRWAVQARRAARWQWVSAAVAVILLGAYAVTLPDGRLHVYVLDVGQGDALFVQTPRGRQILIDGGPDPTRLLSALGHCMPFWDRRLDLVVLTAPTDERLTGLVPALERYRVDYVLQGAWTESGALQAHWDELLTALPADSLGALHAGDSWALDDGVTLEVLWPPPETAGPLVLRLVYGDTAMLLPGGATTTVEEGLVARYGPALRSAVLALPRHGAETSSTPAFLEAVAPEQVAISVGAENRSGDPAPTVLARVLDADVYRTDQQGTLEFVLDGTTVQARPERP